MKVAGSVVIVTGASAGIGKATAELLAQAGANVVVTARRAERLHRLAADLEACPGRRLALPGDIRQEAFARQLVTRTTAEFGRLDVLVNNAAIGHKSYLAQMPVDHMHTVLETNVLGPLYTIQAAVPTMKAQGYGQIINVSSIVGQRPLPQSALYCASKTALNFLSRSLRIELRPDNITVTLVYPGLTATEFTQAKLGQKQPNRWGLRGVPPSRVGRAIVRAIRYGRTEVYVTWYDWLAAHLSRLFPRIGDSIVARGAHLA